MGEFTPQKLAAIANQGFFFFFFFESQLLNIYQNNHSPMGFTSKTYPLFLCIPLLSLIPCLDHCSCPLLVSLLLLCWQSFPHSAARGIHGSLNQSLLCAPPSHGFHLPTAHRLCTTCPPAALCPRLLPSPPRPRGFSHSDLLALPPTHLPTSAAWHLLFHLPGIFPKAGSSLSIRSQTLLSKLAPLRHPLPHPLFRGFMALWNYLVLCLIGFCVSSHLRSRLKPCESCDLVHLIHLGGPSSPHRAIRTANVCWMDEWMDGWIDGCMHACMDRCMDGRMRAWIVACMGAWVDRCMDGWMDGRVHGRMDACMHAWVDA